MAEIVFDQDVTVTNGGTAYDGFVLRVWAEQEGGTVSWYAQSITQYYAKTRVQDIDGYHYGDLGCMASYVVLHVGNLESNKVKVANGTKFGDNYTTQSSWVRTAHETQPATDPILVSAPAERYDVSIAYTGGLQGERTVQEGGGVSALLNVGGAIVPVAAVWINVGGSIVQPTVWGNVGGSIVSFGG